MSFTFGDPSLVNVGPGRVTFRTHTDNGTRTVEVKECMVIGNIVKVVSSDDRRLVFPVSSLVLHEQDREVKS